MDDAPEVPILLLGDANVGKSTFISYACSNKITMSSSNAAHSRLTLGEHDPTKSGVPPLLRDLDQPFPFNVRMYARPYRFEFFDTASPTHYTLLKPAVIILCYSIAQPESLQSLQTHWKEVVETHFNQKENIPVIVLGLKRDVRSKSDYDGHVRRMDSQSLLFESDDAPMNPRTFVYPQEALQIAQEMRCDRYCECSAITGELCHEVFEDIARTAAMTTTSRGGLTDGTLCTLM